MAASLSRTPSTKPGVPSNTTKDELLKMQRQLEAIEQKQERSKQKVDKSRSKSSSSNKLQQPSTTPITVRSGQETSKPTSTNSFTRPESGSNDGSNDEKLKRNPSRKADKSTQQEDTQTSNDSDIRYSTTSNSGSTRSQSDDNLNNINKRPVRVVSSDSGTEDVEKPRRASVGAPERRKSVKKATQLERTFFSANDTVAESEEPGSSIISKQVQPFAFPDVAQLPKSNKKLDPIGASPSLRGRRLDPISSVPRKEEAGTISGTLLSQDTVVQEPLSVTSISEIPPTSKQESSASIVVVQEQFIQVQPTPIPFTNIITKPPDDDVNVDAKEANNSDKELLQGSQNSSAPSIAFQLFAEDLTDSGRPSTAITANGLLGINRENTAHSNASTTYIESLDKVRSLREIVVEARHHRHEHWHTPIVPPNEAELAIITDLELRIAEELKSLPSLATSPYTSEGSIAASRASVSSGDKNPRLSMLIKNATLKMEKLREETEAERRRIAIETTTQRRLSVQKPMSAAPSVKTQESLAENEFMEDVKDSLWGCFCCCCERKDRRVEPEPLSVYEQQKLELLKSRTSTTVRDSTTSRDKRTSLRPSVTK